MDTYDWQLWAVFAVLSIAAAAFVIWLLVFMLKSAKYSWAQGHRKATLLKSLGVFLIIAALLFLFTMFFSSLRLALKIAVDNIFVFFGDCGDIIKKILPGV